MVLCKLLRQAQVPSCAGANGANTFNLPKVTIGCCFSLPAPARAAQRASFFSIAMTAPTTSFAPAAAAPSVSAASAPTSRAYHVVRVLVGLLLLINAPIAFFVRPADMGLNPEATRTLQSLWDTGYLMHAAKVVELVAGLALLTNRYVRLALLLIAPIVVNIILLDVFKEPKALLMGLPLLLALAYLLWQHRTAYLPLLRAR